MVNKLPFRAKPSPFTLLSPSPQRPGMLLTIHCQTRSNMGRWRLLHSEVQHFFLSLSLFFSCSSHVNQQHYLLVAPLKPPPSTNARAHFSPSKDTVVRALSAEECGSYGGCRTHKQRFLRLHSQGSSTLNICDVGHWGAPLLCWNAQSSRSLLTRSLWKRGGKKWKCRFPGS